MSIIGHIFSEMNKDIHLDLKKFKKVSLLNSNEFSQIYQIEDITTSEKFEAQIFNNFSENFISNFLKHLSEEISFITDQTQPLFIRFQGLSETDFNSENHLVFITEMTTNHKLSNIIQTENNQNPRSNLTEAQKLINIFGIAIAFLYLIKQKVTNLNLTIDDIYETSKFYPKINILTFSKLRSIINGQNDLSSQTDYVFSFLMIAYSILTGQNPFKSEQQRSEFIEKVKNESKSLDYSNRKILEKLVSGCIDESILPERTFKNVLRQLKNSDRFLKEGIQKEEYENYIEYIEMSFQDLLEDFDDDFDDDFMNRSSYFIDPDKIEVLELISYSEISNVYLIKDKDTEQLYTAKVTKKQREKKKYHGSHDLSDIDIFKLIKHPSIINYLGASYIQTKKSRKLAIITEYMPNGSLEDLLNILLKGYIVPFWTDTIKLINIYGIAAAVSYLHSKNIIHGDIKPRNVLLDANLFPKLSDFGLSNIVDSNEKIGSYTPVYFPPEMNDESHISQAVDVYLDSLF